MELTIDNLEKIKSLSQKYGGFYRLEFTFWDLIDLFGQGIWNWEKVCLNDSIVVVDITAKLEATEKELIVNALEITKYRQKEAAKILKIREVTLNRRIKKYRIKHPSWKTNV